MERLTQHPAHEPTGDGILALDAADLELLEAARQVMVKHYRPFWHMVSAAIRGRDGRIWTGIHLGATVGRLSVCAEAVALGRSVLEGDATIDTIVAIRHPKPEETIRDLAVVPPCGACREMLLDHDPEAKIILPSATGLVKQKIALLLPVPYRR